MNFLKDYYYHRTQIVSFEPFISFYVLSFDFSGEQHGRSYCCHNNYKPYIGRPETKSPIWVHSSSLQDPHPLCIVRMKRMDGG